MTPSAIMPGEPSTEVERVKSFVPGLDEVLGGGFLRGGLYMLRNHPELIALIGVAAGWMV